MPNRLSRETSPYLRQHAANPVDWEPWGEAALARARAEERPILLSIGYAACHWCHVMAHESFEDAATAALMNRHFVCIKVDREERPDLDAIYMQAVTRMTGRGGWPMTVVLTPEGEPFFGGTYFPPEPRDGAPGFKQVLTVLADAWATRRAEVRASARQMASELTRRLELAQRPAPLAPALLDGAVQAIGEQFDRREGGFGGAPKFPQVHALGFLLRYHHGAGDGLARRMVEQTLARMAMGGIYDHLGGGFARYATDDRWRVPHFEKMLYDNAQLARLYLHAWQSLGAPLFRRVAVETLDFALRELAAPGGGFSSSLDADSDGEEGRFYAWELDEVEQVLGDDADLFARRYGVTEPGDWEGRNILHVARPIETVADELELDLATAVAHLSVARRRLFDARSARVRPGLDDKVVTGWNGLQIAALADAARVLHRADYLAAAIACAEFVRAELRTPAGRLHRAWSAGEARGNGFLEDYACLAEGLLALYGATFEPRWLAWARELAGVIVTRFRDPDGGGFFDTSDDHEPLLVRPKELEDSAVPSGNAMAASVLLRLAAYTGDGELWGLGASTIAAMAEWLGRAPLAFGHWLQASWQVLAEPRELAIIGEPAAEDTRALLAVVDAAWRPDLVVAVGTEAEAPVVPLLAGRTFLGGRATAYLCRRFACQAPATDPATLAAQLGPG